MRCTCWTAGLAILLLAHCALAHTTVIYPELDDGKTARLLVLHFHPADGSGLMGIQLGATDTKTLKGLESISMIHGGRVLDLSARAMPVMFTVDGRTAPAYRLVLDGKGGYLRAGDYCVVVKHRPHWKPAQGIYIQKVAKFYLNKGERMTDWPERRLADMPEIIPLVEPFRVRTGDLFRAEVVDDRGAPISHATISVEYLDQGIAADSLMRARRHPEMSRTYRILRTDRQGAFSFIPHQPGCWTLTLLDGDAHVLLDGKELRFDSSLSLMVK